MKLEAPDIEKYGERGSAIPGSRLVRDYCLYCKQPIRATREHLGKNSCEECSGEKRALMPGGTYGPQDDTSPGWENVMREYEA